MSGKSQSKAYHFDENQLMPSEEMLEVQTRSQSIKIGIPANSSKDESCLPLTPQAVEILVAEGHQIVIESNAGEKVRYSDLEYSEAGAIVTKNKAEVLQCDYVFKVSPFTKDEIDLLRGHQVLFSMLQLDSLSRECIQKLMQKKVTTIAFEYLKDESGNLPVMQSLSEISGIVAMNVAGELLSNTSNGKGVLFGGVTGISPAAVMFLGAETAAESAARTALGLGAEVKVFDNSISKLRAFERKFNQKIFTSLYYPRVIEKAISSADVVIGAQPFNAIPQYKVSRELVQSMKPGSVIIDLNASQGGCFETTRCVSMSKPTYTDEGVIHYCVSNITTRVARTTTIALSNILASALIEIVQMGGMLNYIRSMKGFREGVYIYSGLLTNRDVANKFGLSIKDLDLLLSAF